MKSELRLRACVVLVCLAGFHLAGCGGDDSVNPTNPDASPVKAGDASSDGPKDASHGDAPKDGSDAAHEGSTPSDGGDAQGD